MKNWESYRRLFPHTENQIYLNHAAIGPLNTNSVTAIQQALHERSQGNIEFWPDSMDVKARFKRLVGDLINASGKNIGVTSNTSMGLNWLAKGMDWAPGDRILLNDFEFPSNVYPFLNLRDQGVEVDFVRHQDGRLDLKHIVSAIGPRTRLLSISFVEFLNGYRNDLARLSKICRERDILFCVDAIQGLGALQLDVRNLDIDFLASGGQKWLMWPLGTAFFYVAPRIFDQLKPMAAGWLSVEDCWEFFDYDLKFQPTSDRFEPGMHNVNGVVGAIPALELMLEIGMENIETRILEHSSYLYHTLQENGYRLFTVPDETCRSGIVTFFHDNAEGLFASLKEQGVHVGLRNGMIRVAPHFYNNRQELDGFLRLLFEYDRK